MTGFPPLGDAFMGVDFVKGASGSEIDVRVGGAITQIFSHTSNFEVGGNLQISGTSTNFFHGFPVPFTVAYSAESLTPPAADVSLGTTPALNTNSVAPGVTFNSGVTPNTLTFDSTFTPVTVTAGTLAPGLYLLSAVLIFPSGLMNAFFTGKVIEIT